MKQIKKMMVKAIFENNAGHFHDACEQYYKTYNTPIGTAMYDIMYDIGHLDKRDIVDYMMQHDEGNFKKCLYIVVIGNLASNSTYELARHIVKKYNFDAVAHVLWTLDCELDINNTEYPWTNHELKALQVDKSELLKHPSVKSFSEEFREGLEKFVKA